MGQKFMCASIKKNAYAISVNIALLLLARKGHCFPPFECLIRRSVKEPIISEKVRFFVDLKNLEHTRQIFHERKENYGRYF